MTVLRITSSNAVWIARTFGTLLVICLAPSLHASERGPTSIFVQGERICIQREDYLNRKSGGRPYSEWSGALHLNITWPTAELFDRKKSAERYPANLVSFTLQAKEPTPKSLLLDRYFAESRDWETERLAGLVRRFERKMNNPKHFYRKDFIYSETEPLRLHFRCSSAFAQYIVNRICTSRMSIGSQFELDYSFDFKLIEQAADIHRFLENMFSLPPCVGDKD